MNKIWKIVYLVGVLVVVGSVFSLAAGAYKVSDYIDQDGALFNTTEPNKATNLSWVDHIHNEIHSGINENETDVADITYDNIIRKSDATPLDANDNRIEDSLELKVSGASVPKVGVIVLYNRSVDLAATDYSSIDAEIKYDYSVINATAISIPCNRLYELSTIQNVELVYEDHEVHAYLDSSVPVIKADTARTTYNVTGSNVTVAVIDTGIDDAHESLDDMGGNPATNNPKVIGFKDFVNFYPDPYDDHGHGTHCAGIAAGTGGDSLYRGVAPGARLVGVKVLNAWGSGSESTVIAGIDWAVQNKDDYGIKIISMSLGRDYNNDGATPMALACDAAVDAGIAVCVAAGNAGGSKTVGDPGCAKKIITVGAIDDDMDIAYFSSRGPTADGRIKPEVCAVGVAVTSADADTGNGYVSYSGTSMSTPHVAGVAALMLEYNPDLTPLEIREILMDTAVDRGRAGPDNVYGWGVVDAVAALPMTVPQEHDIKVILPFSSEYVKINESTPINATIFNKGLNNETDITVQLLINGSINATKTITSLDSGTNCSVNFTWTPYAEGSYKISVYAVPLLGENITINNLASAGINVLSNIYPIGYDTTHGERPSAQYIDIINDIKSEGFIVSDITSGPITLSLLDNYDAIWVDERGGSWTNDEKNALATYVENGGGLFVEGDELGDPTIVNAFNMSYRGIFGFPGESTDLSMHSITRGVSSIYFSPVNSLNVYLPAIDVARDIEGNKMIGARRYGNGKVVVISDEVLYYVYRADNGILGRNIFRWITLPLQAHDIEVLLDAPSIVEINAPAQINAVIANTGLSDETEVIMDFMVNGMVLENRTIPSIQNGTDTTISFNWTPTAVGWHNVSVCAEPVAGEDYLVNNLASCSVHVPEAVLTDEYTDYGIDLDSDNDDLYDYLAIDVGVDVAEAGHYYLYGDLETLNGFYITDASNDTYLSVGKQNITLLFDGIDIRRIDLNGPYTLSDLRLRDNHWNTLDRRLKACNTSFYNSKEFQLPKAMFTDVYNDTSIDTDNDTYYNCLSIDIGVNVSESGYYRWYGELYDSHGDSIAYKGNSSYLENGTQTAKLNFDGFTIRKHKVDGPYHLKYLRLYDEAHVQQDSRHDAYVTFYYGYNGFQPPGAEFNDIYSDYGVDDEDEDNLYNYLVINVGVNVRNAGDYQISGSLYENGTYNSIDSNSNTTYLNKGNQTVQLRFDGITIRQNEYNGTYDLRYLQLYNVTYTYPEVPTPVPTPIPLFEKSEAKATENTDNFTALYGMEFDYRRYAYTTSYYNWTDFQRPPAEFTGNFSDYGSDTDNDTLHDYLIIEAEINVTKAGEYELGGDLNYYDEEGGYWRGIDGDWNRTYLDAGIQNITLQFDGIRIYGTGYNGRFRTWLRLYGTEEWKRIDEMEYFTKDYNYTDFQRPPAEFNDIYSDYGEDTDGDGLYDHLTIEVGVNVTTAGHYQARGYLYDKYGYSIGSDSNYTYLNEGNQTVHLMFDAWKITEGGTFDLKYLYLYDDDWNQLDYRHHAYTTGYYEPLPRPALFNSVYSDYGKNTTTEDDLYDYLVINVGVNVTTAGYYQARGYLYDKYGYSIGYDSNYTYLNTGNQTVQLDFSGIAIRQNEVNGPYDLKYLYLYDDDWNQIDCIYDAYTTSYYNYTDFQRPPAEFSDIYSDYGTDTDGDGLYDYLTIEVGMNVTTSGYYQVEGRLDDSYGGYIEWESNYTYLNAGNQTVQLDFSGIVIRQNGVNGTYDLKYLYLYDDDWNQLDYIRDAYTTSYYNYTDFQRPPAEFTGNFSDYGSDTDNDTLYDYLIIGVEINVTKAGEYELSGDLNYYDKEGSYWRGIDGDWNRTYLDAGIQNITLRFDGIRIYGTGYNGSFRTWLNLYKIEEWCRIDEMEYFTKDYNYTDFQRPPAEFNDIYSDYGEDTDENGLYNNLTVNVGVNVIKAGRYRVRDDLYENATGRYVTSAYNTTYLGEGNRTVQLRFDGMMLRQNGYNGTYDLKRLRLYNATYPASGGCGGGAVLPIPIPEHESEEPIEEGEISPESVSAIYGEQLDYRRYAYTTSYYNWTDFQRPPAEFTGNSSDYGIDDADNDTFYNYLVIEAEINVTKAGEYELGGDLNYYDEEGGYWGGIDGDWNRTYLDAGIQNITLRFDGIRIYGTGFNGSFRAWLNLYETEEWKRIDEMEYSTRDYNYTDFQRPPAEFTDVYSDYGEDTDGDGLYNNLTVNVGVNVTKAGTYNVRGELYENATHRYIISAYNTTYLDMGDHNVSLKFDGIRLRENRYNGTYDLKYLYLYNYSYSTPSPAPMPTPIPVSQLEKSEAIEVEDVSGLYGERLDRRYYAYTTGYYEWPGWQRPPAEFTDIYSDYGEDTDIPPDGLNNSLVIEVGVNVTKAGTYRVSGELCENATHDYIISAYNTTYLDMGDHNVSLKFDGIRLRENRYNGTYDLKYLYLYNYSYSTPSPAPMPTPIPVSQLEKSEAIEVEDVSGLYGERLDRRYYAYTTGYYEWPGWQRPPAEFTDVYSDYGSDTDGDGLYDYLTIEVGVDVTTAGSYRVYGKLYENGTYDNIDYDSNMTYLNEGNQTVQLMFDAWKITKNGTFDLKYLYLYNSSTGVQFDYRCYAYTTGYYEPRPRPALFNDVYSDYGEDTDTAKDGLYNYLVINVSVDVTVAGNYRISGGLYENGTYNSVGYADNTSYLTTGNQTVQLKFEGIKIRHNGYNGTFDLKYLYLYDEVYHQLDYIYDAYTTSYYNYTDFQRPPAEFTDVYSDYGEDTDGDDLYDNLTIEVGVDVIETGYYRVNGQLYESNSYNSSDYDGNTIYLSNGSQTVQLRFEGIKMRQNRYNGTYDLKYLYLYNSSTGTRWDYISNAYTTSYYNYTDFQTNPPCFNYTMEYVTYAWDAIDADQIWTGCDDCSYNYVLPWNFTFFCEDHSSIQISTNGLITFPPDTSSHCCSPDFENTEAIAPFWGDLSQACEQGTHISVQDKGDRVVVVWYTGTCGGGCLDKDLFEVILYETGEIRFNYNYLNNIPHSVDAGIGNGIVYYINTWNDNISVVYSPSNVTAILPGDLNHDGTLTPADATIALQLAASGGWDDAADVNNDSRITSLDALMILQAAADAIDL